MTPHTIEFRIDLPTLATVANLINKHYGIHIKSMSHLVSTALIILCEGADVSSAVTKITNENIAKETILSYGLMPKLRTKDSITENIRENSLPIMDKRILDQDGIDSIADHIASLSSDIKE